MRKTILAISLVLIAVFAVGSASAFDLGSLFGEGENQTVTIDGIDFNVPAGFEEDPNEEISNQQRQQSGMNYTTNGKLYEKGDDIVVVLVADYGDYKVDDDVAQAVGGDKQIINNVTGYLSEDGKYKVFNYAKNDKLVVLSTNNEDLLSDFIIE